MRAPVAGATLILLLALTGTASAGGGPALGADVGGVGVSAPGSAWRFVALPAGAGRTMVMRIARQDGRVDQWLRVDGRYVVPTVSADGTATGLSADGRTLVLAEPRLHYPIRRSRFAVFDGRTLRARRPIALRGDFTLDAVSPDGRLVYFVHHPTPRDPTEYEVRVFDLVRRHLRARPVVDPDEAVEEMRGTPLARSGSVDGRWAYTLYDGNGAHPFVHALDTVNAEAVCVDLDALARRDDLWSMDLSTAEDGTVMVHGDTRPLLAIEPRTFEVSVPAAEAAAPARPRETRAAGSDGLLVLAAALLGLAALGAVRVRRG